MNLYFEDKNSERRRTTQSTCHYLLTTLVRFLSPVFTFMTEEVYLEYESLVNQNNNSYFNTNNNSNNDRDKSNEEKNDVKSVHLSSFDDAMKYTWVDVYNSFKEKEKEKENYNQCDYFKSEEDLKSVWKELMYLRKNLNVIFENGRKEKLFCDEKQNELSLVFFEEENQGMFVNYDYVFVTILIFDFKK
jgi:isoleucyl-tRNA synthetase